MKLHRSKHEEREQYSLVGSGRGLSPDEFVVEKSSREFYEKNNKKVSNYWYSENSYSKISIGSLSLKSPFPYLSLFK